LYFNFPRFLPYSLPFPQDIEWYVEADVQCHLPRIVFFLVSWGGVRLNPLGTSATNWPIVPVPECGAIGGMRMVGETEVLGTNLPQCHFVHHKSHMTRPVLEHEPQRWEAGDSIVNLLLYMYSELHVTYRHQSFINTQWTWYAKTKVCSLVRDYVIKLDISLLW
jgi:hypothetical protein